MKSVVSVFYLLLIVEIFIACKSTSHSFNNASIKPSNKKYNVFNKRDNNMFVNSNPDNPFNPYPQQIKKNTEQGFTNNTNEIIDDKEEKIYNDKTPSIITDKDDNNNAPYISSNTQKELYNKQNDANILDGSNDNKLNTYQPYKQNINTDITAENNPILKDNHNKKVFNDKTKNQILEGDDANTLNNYKPYKQNINKEFTTQNNSVLKQNEEKKLFNTKKQLAIIDGDNSTPTGAINRDWVKQQAKQTQIAYTNKIKKYKKPNLFNKKSFWALLGFGDNTDRGEIVTFDLRGMIKYKSKPKIQINTNAIDCPEPVLDATTLAMQDKSEGAPIIIKPKIIEDTMPQHLSDSLAKRADSLQNKSSRFLGRRSFQQDSSLLNKDSITHNFLDSNAISSKPSPIEIPKSAIDSTKRQQPDSTQKPIFNNAIPNNILDSTRKHIQ